MLGWLLLVVLLALLTRLLEGGRGSECRRIAECGSHHQVLGVSPGCSRAQARAAFRRLAVRFHPDKCKDPMAAAAFARILAAYRALG